MGPDIYPRIFTNSMNYTNSSIEDAFTNDDNYCLLQVKTPAMARVQLVLIRGSLLINNNPVLSFQAFRRVFF